MIRYLCLLAVVCAAFTGSPAYAHESRPIYVGITETSPGMFDIHWKVPVSVPFATLPAPVMPEHCATEHEAIAQQQAGAYMAQQRYRCKEGLSGHALGMRFPASNPSLSTLFQINLANGAQHVRILRPGESGWTVPDAESRLAVAGQYTLLGIEHIWLGIDHLLFVACLLWVARTARKLLLTITGFTLAHSLTLVLSVLELITVPVAPVEAVIALSIVFLAYEIARGNESSLTFRYPVAVSTSFGLLHGFGFAAALREIGLPQTELPTALLFFNVGVEIGQVLFVAVLAGAFLTLKNGTSLLAYPLRSNLTLPASYAIGSVSSYWLIERISGF